MSKKQQDVQNPTTFPKKWDKVLKDLPEFKDEADAASVEELKQLIIQSEGNIYNIEKEKQDDEKLNAAKDLVKDLGAGYRESQKILTCKVKYCLFLLSEKGQELGTSVEEE